ncbi:MAG: thiamine-phosphate kinase [Alphaproteobacteria bacterium]
MQQSQINKMGEFERIAKFLTPLTHGNHHALGLCDDVAMLPPIKPNQCHLTSKDMLVEGVHFLRHSDPFLLAQKLLCVNLSDLAAKGATPLCYMLGLGLTDDCSDEWLARFCAGLAKIQHDYGLYLLGGDSVSCPNDISLAVTIIGESATDCRDRPLFLTRHGAKAGDDLYVSGVIGDGHLGLLYAQQRPLISILDLEQQALLRKAYETPSARIDHGLGLIHLLNANHYTHEDHAICALDVSDGLLADIGHLIDGAAQQGLGATVDLPRIPLSAAAAKLIAEDMGLLLDLITGGDDYELVFCARPQLSPQLETLSQHLPLYHIGKITAADTPITLLDRDGFTVPYDRTGWDHRPKQAH